ncbi:hypothetical protein BKA57DRAFT_151639 [Linnemannia elongata]|nr:hypothetical protein BKA57DRAFT_151639 [Linnemannia elongata]
MSLAPSNSQGIRSINIGNLTPAPPTAAEIVYVDIYTDQKTKQACILWEDIQLAFYNALHVRHKARIVPFVRDSNLETRPGLLPSQVRYWILSSVTYRTPPLNNSSHQFSGRLSNRQHVSRSTTHFPQCGPCRQTICPHLYKTLDLHRQGMIFPAQSTTADNNSTSRLFKPATRSSPNSTPRTP